ncbi:hypothetical protein BU26DRAFT_184469 [Trematosphaeria pertusa]|uniref:Uncharacterized protein n=1 Tax=Trematosphaeria pertusa TaxID=390896 RepID=A0A6A6HRY2_9PLEO|nr:uncharacterized protein BU26DRAFT_184469 [Trematosphaeria pertusa]KAF2240915.1 hypothetical protein BU26DRAFT_184469 [Trematosphaeria pertusa]
MPVGSVGRGMFCWSSRAFNSVSVSLLGAASALRLPISASFRWGEGARAVEVEEPSYLFSLQCGELSEKLSPRVGSSRLAFSPAMLQYWSNLFCKWKLLGQVRECVLANSLFMGREGSARGIKRSGALWENLG